jgi:hypothetical protein
MLSAQDYINQWKAMNEEFVEDNTPFIIAVPSLEATEQWIKESNEPTDKTSKPSNE